MAITDFKHGVHVILDDDSLSATEPDQHCIYILKMDNKDNRFNPAFCESLNLALDFIETDCKSKSNSSDNYKFAMVITGNEKFYSNGLDLSYLLTTPNPNQFLIDHYEPLMYRFLTFGIPTIAAISGHAFAAGMCLALAQDYRIALSSGRALLSMNELLIKAAIPAGMLSILRAKLANPQVLRDCIRAKRWNIKQAHQDKIIDELASHDLIIEAITFAKSVAIKGDIIPTFSAIKHECYRDACALLLDPKSDRLDPFRFALNITKSKL